MIQSPLPVHVGVYESEWVSVMWGRGSS